MHVPRELTTRGFLQCLGPKVATVAVTLVQTNTDKTLIQAMMKMVLDPMGGILLTNDGHAILRVSFLIALFSL